MVILEEAAHMDPAVFFKVCVPLLGVANTALLAISTISDEFNYYTELSKIPGNGPNGLLFLTLEIGFQCAACKAANVACTCPIRSLPPWKHKSGQAKVELIYGSQTNLMMQETRGVVCSSRQYMFQSFLSAFKERPMYSFPYSCPYLLMGIDPSGGGQSSDYAVAMITSDNCRTPIVGLDSSSSTKHNDILQMLERFILRTRSYRTYRDSHIFVFIEANMSFISADMIANFMRNPRFGSVEAVSLDPKNKQRYGVWTGEVEKERYAEAMERALANGSLCYASEQVGDPDKWEANKKAFEEQTGWYRREVDEAKNPAFNKNKVTFTGKSSGRKDDMTIVVQLLLYHLERLKTSVRFCDMAREYGWRY